jgi:hypothetical protein
LEVKTMDLQGIKTRDLKAELISKGLLNDLSFELDGMIEDIKRGFKRDIKRNFNDLYIIRG